jgi:hypothetical protein
MKQLLRLPKTLAHACSQNILRKQQQALESTAHNEGNTQNTPCVTAPWTDNSMHA